MQRGWQDNPVFPNEPYTQREAWEWLVANAAFTDRRVRIGNDIVDVPRGDVAASLRFLVRAWKWKSDTRVRNFLKRIEDEGMIRIGKTDTKKSLQITVCNYDRYQAFERRENAGKTQTERKIEQGNKTSSLRSEVSAPAKKKRAPATPKASGPIPDDWRDDPRAMLALENMQRIAVKRGMTQETAINEAIGFIEWHLEAGTTSTAWGKNWSTWCGGWVKSGSRQFVPGGNAPRNGFPPSGGQSEELGGMAGAIMRRRRRNADGDRGTGGEGPVSEGRGFDHGSSGGGTVIDARPVFDDRGGSRATMGDGEASEGRRGVAGFDAGSLFTVSE